MVMKILRQRRVQRALLVALGAAALGALLFAVWLRPAPLTSGLTILTPADFVAPLHKSLDAMTTAAGVPLRVGTYTVDGLDKVLAETDPALVVIIAEADVMDQLIVSGRVSNGVTEIARNRLVFAALRSFSKRPARNGADLFAGGKLVTGDPLTTTLGRAAQEALINLGFPENTERYIVAAPSADAAAQWLKEGAAKEGILYRSDAAQAKDLAVLDEIPETMHEPIIYFAAPSTRAAEQAAEAVLNFLQSDNFEDVVRDMGYDVPPHKTVAVSREVAHDN